MKLELLHSLKLLQQMLKFEMQATETLDRHKIFYQMELNRVNALLETLETANSISIN